VELKLNGTYQLLAIAHNLKVQRDKVDIINRNTETLIDCMYVGREVNVDERYLLVLHGIFCCLFIRIQVKFVT
jgi:hypothetical protein